jgi:hypothetical protein
VDKCYDTTFVWFSLLARAARRTIGKYDWQPHLPLLFNVFLQTVNMPISGKQDPSQSRSWPKTFSSLFSRRRDKSHWVVQVRHQESVAVFMSTICVANIYKGSNAMQLINNFLQSVITYFHPSNYGSWTTTLVTFLYGLSYFHTRRLARERDGNAQCAAQYFLNPADMTMCDLILPITMQALYSKSAHVVMYAGLTLRDLCSVYPQTVLPPLMDEFYPSLTDLSKPHRMYSALKTLIILTRPLLHRKNFPNGANHIPMLLDAVLPAIDSGDLIKTCRTLLWLCHVFSHVPLIDAMDSNEQKVPEGWLASYNNQTDEMHESDRLLKGRIY